MTFPTRPIARFLARRIAYSLVVLIGVLIAVFALVQLVPGDPVRIALGTRYTPEAYDALRAASGLDQPLVSQFFSYTASALTGDLGVSFRNGDPVAGILLDRLPATVSLAAVGIVIAVAIALPAGIWSALREGRASDVIVRVTSQFGVSIPDFWMAILLIALFSTTLGWLPTSGYRPLFGDPGGWLRHLILPGLTVGLVAGAVLTRYVRAAVLEVAAMGYVRTARSKGLPPRVVTFRHTVRNALVPILTITGIQLATILGGVIVVEVVFAWPGLGRLVYNAVAARDYPVIQGAVLLIAVLFLAINLIVDLLYAVVDPRIRPVMTDPTFDDTEASSRVAGWRLLVGNPVTVATAVVLAVVIVIAVGAQWIAPYGINDVDVPNALRGPSGEHWFGTDELGRDVLSRVLVAIQASMSVAVVSVAFAVAVGVSIGVVAGYRGGWVDTVFMRIVDVMFAFPVLLLALAIVAILGPGVTTTMLAIGVVYTPIFARVARASTLSVRLEPFVQASRTMGTGHSYILVRHVLPNIAGPLIVQTSLSLAFAILSEAALSFLGLGIQPPEPSLGRMIFDSQGFVTLAWWMAVFPGAAIFVIVLAFNLFGDGLRDVLDPKQRTMAEARRRR